MRPDDDRLDDGLAAALGAAAEGMPARSRNRVRRRVLANARAERRGGFFASAAHRVAVAMTAASVLGGGFAYAAETSLPGDALYGVKRAAEDALVALLPPGRLERRVLVGLAARRAAETAELARRGVTPALVEESLERLREAVREVGVGDEALLADEVARIRARADEAPETTREAIDGVIAPAPDGSPAGDGGSRPAIGTPDPGVGGPDDTNGGSPSGPEGTDGGSSGGARSDTGPGPGDGEGQRKGE